MLLEVLVEEEAVESDVSELVPEVSVVPLPSVVEVEAVVVVPVLVEVEAHPANVADPANVVIRNIRMIFFFINKVPLSLCFRLIR